MNKYSFSSQLEIMIVDDYPDNLRLLLEIFKLQGYQVRTAINGTRALQAIEQKVCDLVLLDINMPDLDGYEVCQALKNNEKTKDIPVIFMSTFDSLLDIVKVYEYGAVDYINKPFLPIEVLIRVNNQLNQINCHKQVDRLKLELEENITSLIKELEDIRVMNYLLLRNFWLSEL